MSKLFFSFLILGFFVFVFSISAQTAPNLQSIIKQLQDQIKLLNQQILDLQSRLKETEKEVEIVKSELKLSKSLKKGDSNDEVRQLQEFLKQFPDIYPEGLVSGFFGSLTETAVKRFQEKHGIESIGIVGPKTIQKLNEFSVSGTPAIPAVPAIPAIPAIPASLSLPLQPASPSQPIVIAIPAIPAIPAVPGVSSATPAIPAIPAQPSSSTSTPTPTVTVSVSPSPIASGSATKTPTPTPSTNDKSGPWITSLSISPTSVPVGTKVTFSATAEDSTGILRILYDIRYPSDYRFTGSPYYLRPSCNFNGVKNGTCVFSESVEYARQPPTYGQYIIETIRIIDTIDNIATYYPNGTVSNSIQNTHNLTIPVITVNASTPTSSLTPTPAPTPTPAKPEGTIYGNDGTWCYDSDGFKGWFTKGYCQDNTGTYNDSCYLGYDNIVNDYSCGVYGIYSTYGQQTGNTTRCVRDGWTCSGSLGNACSNGICINTTTSTPTPTPAPTASVSFSPSTPATANVLEALRTVLQNLNDLLFKLKR